MQPGPQDPNDPTQPPPYGQQPPSYGQQPPAYGEQPPAYGQQPPTGGEPGYPPPGGASRPSNGLGLTSLILGIAAFPLLCCLYLGFPVGIAAAILGFLGKKKAEQGLATNRGQAMAGLICGVSAVALGILLIVLGSILQLKVPTYQP